MSLEHFLLLVEAIGGTVVILLCFPFCFEWMIKNRREVKLQ